MTNFEEVVVAFERHEPRDFTTPGQQAQTRDEKAGWSGAGESFGREAPISREGMENAEARGFEAYIPELNEGDKIYLGPSDVKRAEQTTHYSGTGMLFQLYGRLGLEPDQFRKVHILGNLKPQTSAEFNRFDWESGKPLREANFKAYNQEGTLVDDPSGHQLFVESGQPDVKAEYAKHGLIRTFAYQADVAFDRNDPRVEEHPQDLADRALNHFLGEVSRGPTRVARGATHDFNIDAIARVVDGSGVGNNAVDLYDGNPMPQAGTLEMVFEVDKGSGLFAPEFKWRRTDASLVGEGNRSGLPDNYQVQNTQALGKYVQIAE